MFRDFLQAKKNKLTEEYNSFMVYLEMKFLGNLTCQASLLNFSLVKTKSQFKGGSKHISLGFRKTIFSEM